MSSGPSVAHYDYALFGPIEARPLSEVRRIIADRTLASWRTVPQCTLYEIVDVTELDCATMRLTATSDGMEVRPSLLAFVAEAAISALKAHPEFNASISEDGQSLVLKRYYNLAFAVDTPAGLIAPVLHGADGLGVRGLTTAISRLADKARAGRLDYNDVEGGSFTISSLGKLGGEGFSPIVNAPEVAILGVARAEDRAVVRDGGVTIRRILPISLSFDHRAVDGAQAGRFLGTLSDALSAMITDAADGERAPEAVPWSPPATGPWQA